MFNTSFVQIDNDSYMFMSFANGRLSSRFTVGFWSKTQAPSRARIIPTSGGGLALPSKNWLEMVCRPIVAKSNF